ncbi:hypothetical protein BDD12DRAFT_888899 [Trichophaea hybrida]|nr:hypothetical protein BDD12DRAFT_888899 [Trichophaea hybrida]
MVLEIRYRVIHSNIKLTTYHPAGIKVPSLSALRLEDVLTANLEDMEWYSHAPRNTNIRYGGFRLGNYQIVPFWSVEGFDDALKEVIATRQPVEMITITFDFDEEGYRKMAAARTQRFKERLWQVLTPEEAEWKDGWFKGKPEKPPEEKKPRDEEEQTEEGQSEEEQIEENHFEKVQSEEEELEKVKSEAKSHR